MKCLESGSPTRKYSATVRKFCFTLHYYSPSAYGYLRELFFHHLPSPRTIRAWYSTINISPSFTSASFDVLKQKSDMIKANNGRLLVGLMLDGMFVRQHSQWDMASKKFLGHNMVREEDDNQTYLPLASSALTFMVVGLEEDFKIPVGYFFNNKTNADELTDLIDQAMCLLNSTGCTLVSLTYDGAKENLAVGKYFGATMEQPYIINPYDTQNKVYLILDPPHMIKLIRNVLGTKQVLYNQNDVEIKWEFIEKLVKLQIDQNINLGNKLNLTHLKFKDKKMNVRLACETVSKSVSNSIKYADAHMKLPEFVDSEATSEYLLLFNNLFDVMNSKMGHCKNEYKRPFTDTTKAYFNDLFQNARSYINSLKVMEADRKISILKSRSHTGYFGFIQNMTSFSGIFEDYGLTEFYTFSVSQDKLETFFGIIRRMGGCNDNPTEQHYSAAYKKLLFQNAIKSSIHGNCLNDVTKVLSVSSAKTIKTKINTGQDLQRLADFDLENSDDVAQNSTQLSELQSHNKAYYASIVEKSTIGKLARKGKKKCMKCIDVFIENEITHDSFIEFQSENCNMYQPCQSTVDIIFEVDALLEKYESLEVSYEAAVEHISQTIDISALYSQSFSDDHVHKAELIKIIIETYLDKRSTAESRILTRLSKGDLVRHKNLKDTQRMGQ